MKASLSLSVTLPRINIKQACLTRLKYIPRMEKIAGINAERKCV